MVPGRSAETSRELADERTVRTFLERAAPIILESRTLEGERFEAVLALAEEIGLTREQLSCELRFLELRGVITSAPGVGSTFRRNRRRGGPGRRPRRPSERGTAERPAETAPRNATGPAADRPASPALAATAPCGTAPRADTGGEGS